MTDTAPDAAAVDVPAWPCVGHHPDTPPPADLGFLCNDCFRRIRSTLTQLPHIAVWLAANQAATGQADSERVTGTREDPIPLRPDVLDLIGPDSTAPVPQAAPVVLLWEDGLHIGSYPTWRTAHAARWQEILDSLDVDADPRRWQVRVTERGGCDQTGEDSIRNTLAYWVLLTAEEAADDPDSDPAWMAAPTLEDLSSLTGWLAGRLSWIVAQPWVDEFDGQLARLVSQAHRLAPWREEIIRDRDHPCPACHVRAVVLHVARSVMVCEKRMGGCGRSETSPYLKQATA